MTEIVRLHSLHEAKACMCVFLQWNSTHIFLIMEYCSGGDLSSFIHSRVQLRESSARKFLRQLGE